MDGWMDETRGDAADEAAVAEAPDDAGRRSRKVTPIAS